MFVFDQERFITGSARRVIGKSVCPLVYCTTVELEESEVVIRCTVLKREFSKNGTSLNFDS